MHHTILRPWRWALVLLPLCALALTAAACHAAPQAQTGFPTFAWEPIGFSGGGGMFAAAISPIDPDLMMLNCDMSGAYVTTDGGRHWRMIHHQQLSSNTRCRPGFHPKDRDTIYAPDGWSGTLKVSHDRGVTWSVVAKNVPGGIYAEVHLDPDYPNTLLVGSEDGAAISHDAGKTWTKCSTVTGKPIGFGFDRTSPQNARVIFAATETGFFRSEDGGRTWVPKPVGLPWKEIHSFAVGSNPRSRETILYLSVTSKIENGEFAGGLYRSRNRGEQWESAMGEGSNTDTHTFDEWADGPIAQYPFLLTTDANPSRVYAVNTSTGFWPPHNPGVFRSDDAGATWRQTMYMDPRFMGQYNVQPDYFTASQGRSDQAGAFSAAICNSDPDRVARVGGVVWITRNGGRTWEAGHTSPAPGQQPGVDSAWVNNGLVITTTWHYYIDPFEPNRHYIAYTDLGYGRSLDAGKTWIWMPEKDAARMPPWRNTCYEMAFDPEIPGKIWGAFSNLHDIPNYNIIGGAHGSQAPGGVCLSTDFAASWQPVKNGGLPEKACTSIVLDPKSPKGNRTLYVSFFDDGVYKSTDDGKTWVKKSQGLGAPANIRVYRLLLHPDGTLFALITAKRENRQFLTDGVGIYRSRDGGESWQKITASLHARWLKDFAVDPASSDTVFVGAANTGLGDNGLYRTRDGGEAWQRVAQKENEHFGAYFDPKRPGWIYLTVTEGASGPSLWLSRDGGGTWRSIDNFPFANTQRVEFDRNDPNVIYVTTFGASIWRGRMR